MPKTKQKSEIELRERKLKFTQVRVPTNANPARGKIQSQEDKPSIFLRELILRLIDRLERI